MLIDVYSRGILKLSSVEVVFLPMYLAGILKFGEDDKNGDLHSLAIFFFNYMRGKMVML